MGQLETLCNLIDAQRKCTAIARRILNEPTAQAYCSPRWGPFDHVHVMINGEGADMDRDPLAYFDSQEEDDCYGEIPNTDLLVAAIQKEITGAGVSVVVCA